MALLRKELRRLLLLAVLIFRVCFTPSTSLVHVAIVQYTCKPLDWTQLSCPQFWVVTFIKPTDREQEPGPAHKSTTESLQAQSLLLLPVNPLGCMLTCLRWCKMELTPSMTAVYTWH